MGLELVILTFGVECFVPIHRCGTSEVDLVGIDHLSSNSDVSFQYFGALDDFIAEGSQLLRCQKQKTSNKHRPDEFRLNEAIHAISQFSAIIKWSLYK